MKLGMPTLVEYTSLIENIQLCNTLGLKFIELNMNLPICTPESLSPSELRYYKEEYEMDFTIHLPEEIDISSFHPSIRIGHIERCRQAMEWANLSGIKTLNMHLNSGIYFTLPERRVWINEQYKSKFLELLHESYVELYDLANSHDVELCIENTGNFQIPYVREALDKLSAFPNFFLTWDVGHDAKAGFEEEEVFTHFNDRIRHMHLHDYNGKSDHQSLYTGIVPVNNRLDFAQKNGLSVVVEVKTSESLTKSISELRRNGFLN